MATWNGNNLGIFKVGVFVVGQFNGVSKFVSDRPLLKWQPTDDFQTQNWLKLG